MGMGIAVKAGDGVRLRFCRCTRLDPHTVVGISCGGLGGYLALPEQQRLGLDASMNPSSSRDAERSGLGREQGGSWCLQMRNPQW